ncbi:MAG: site-specific integrase [Planctomycetes bacterium]|nr:site-specific integrase [Planctomycetota bacterium]
MEQPAGGPQRSRRRKKRKRSPTDALRGVVAVRLKDGRVRYRASIPTGRRGVKDWTPLLETAELAAEFRRRQMEKVASRPPLTMTFEDAIAATRKDYAQRCRPDTLEWFDFQVPTLRKFFGTMLVATITPEDVRRFAAQQMASGIAPGTVLHRRRGLRAVFSAAGQGQFPNGDPLTRAGKVWPKLRHERPTAPDADTVREFLRKTIAPGDARAREDHDIVAALYLTGMRRSELARLRAEDLRPDEGRIFVTGKVRNEPLSVNVEAFDVLNRMAARVDGKGSLVPGGKLAISDTLRRLSQRHRVHITPKMLRRAFVTALIRAGHDVPTVAQYSRHTSDEIRKYMAATVDDRRVLAAVSIAEPKRRKKKAKGRARLRVVE